MSNSERSLQQHKSISYGAFEKPPQQGEKRIRFGSQSWCHRL